MAFAIMVVMASSSSIFAIPRCSVQRPPILVNHPPFDKTAELCVNPNFALKLNLMEYRGIRYTIRSGIERGQWFVVIHPQGVEVGKKISGTREGAEYYAHYEPKSRQRTNRER